MKHEQVIMYLLYQIEDGKLTATDAYPLLLNLFNCEHTNISFQPGVRELNPQWQEPFRLPDKVYCEDHTTKTNPKKFI